MSRPVFLLGVGAHKSGTSFLHRALRDHPQAALSNPKEMHVFDAHFLPQQCGQFHERRREALRIRLADEKPRSSPRAQERTAAMQRHLRMHHDLNEYLAYFRDLARGKALTGEITPSYQMLEAEHFAQIKALLEDDFDIRVVFLMRDPIDRVFSAMRMDDRNQNRHANLAHERFGTTFMHAKHKNRTDYDRLIPALEAVFAPEQLYFEFYENLFAPQSFTRLENFLGLDGLTPDFETRVNASPTLGKLNPGEVAAARSFYAPTYDFCRDRFGADRVEQFWAHA